jgi:adenylate cyclase
LVANDGWRGKADTGHRLRQAYLAETDRAAIRVRIVDDASATITIKSANPGLSRQEFEYPLPLADAEALTGLRQGAVLEKTRYHAPHAGHDWEVDVYSGENAGLVVAEIELNDEAEVLDPPPWLGREVTGDARYYAARLAARPFLSWGHSSDRGEL